MEYKQIMNNGIVAVYKNEDGVEIQIPSKFATDTIIIPDDKKSEENKKTKKKQIAKG